MAVTALLLGVLAVTGTVEVWHVYVLAFVFGVGSAFDAPARQSFVSEMVGPDDLTNAVGLNSASFNAARAAGPGARRPADRRRSAAACPGHRLGDPDQRPQLRRGAARAARDGRRRPAPRARARSATRA